MIRFIMAYAVIRASGAQYRVSEGDELDLFHLEGKKEGDSVEFLDVLLVKNDKDVVVGTPVVSGAHVVGKVTKLLLGDKVRVATYTAKSRHRKVKGHRDQLTRVKIDRVVVGK